MRSQINHFKLYVLCRDAKKNSRKCDFCNIDVQRASYAKQLRRKLHYENEKQEKMIIPEWLFKETIENIPRKKYNPRPLREIVTDNIKKDDKKLTKELAKKMTHPAYFNDRPLQIGFNITLDSHHTYHASFKLSIKPNYVEIGIETRNVKKSLEQLATFYARLLNQYKYKH